MYIHIRALGCIEIPTHTAHQCTYITCKIIYFFFYAIPEKKKIKSKHGGTEKTTCIIHLISIVLPFEPQPNHFVH